MRNNYSKMKSEFIYFEKTNWKEENNELPITGKLLQIKFHQ